MPIEKAFCESVLSLGCSEGVQQDSCEEQIVQEITNAVNRNCEDEFLALLECEVNDELSCPENGVRPFESANCASEEDALSVCDIAVQHCHFSKLYCIADRRQPVTSLYSTIPFA
jgi:hypothetical protein